MNKVDMMEVALKEIGDASALDLTAFLQSRFGVTVGPQFVPVLKASVREKEILESARRRVMASTGPVADGPPQVN